MGLNKIKKAKEQYCKGVERRNEMICDMTRMENVLHNIDDIVDDLDKEFSEKTGITNKEDMAFLSVAIILQCTRWILMPELDLDFEQISQKDRLSSSEKKKDGMYHGKRSGDKYEKPKINRYIQKYEDKFNIEKEKYSQTIRGETPYKYRSWIEILIRAVPYDAMNATENSRNLIPSIRGLNKVGSNINGRNHHTATLGHDPVLGWIFGTMDIISQRITFINLMSYDVVCDSIQLDKWEQHIDYSHQNNFIDTMQYCIGSINEDAKRLPAAVFRQGIHLQSDKYTKEGLPIPFLSTINPVQAQKLIEKGWNSNEVERLLQKALKDAAIVGAQAIICMIINFIIKSIYLMGGTEADDMELKLREVRINKILLISNIIASSSNLLYVTVTKNIKKLDIGGIGVTLLNLLKSKDFMDKVKYEFISYGIEQAIIGDKKWENYYLWEENSNEKK